MPIRPDHRLAGFECGEQSLDHWLRTKAIGNEGRTARTYVVEASAGAEAGTIVAYYALATGSVQRAELKSAMRHAMPEMIPAMVLGRLAVDRRHQGAGLGAGLLRDAIQRTIEVSRTAGVRMLVVHAIGEEAANFYRRHGFIALPRAPLTLLLPIETMVAAL